MTPHVRHRHKYLDMPLPEARAFVFVRDGKTMGQRASTLKEFTEILAAASPAMLDGHLRNGDFSRWVAGAFRDNPLAAQIQELESQYRMGLVPDVNDALIQLVEDRYQLVTKA